VPLLVALGVVGALAHFALVAALARAPAAKLSPYDYLTIVWAVALGAILFRHWPAPHEIAGMAMIIATGFVGSLGTKAARPIASGK
jgi:drug/metabolite transporter (DMT)-like permease